MRIKVVLQILFGFIFLVLALIGIVLPVWPTTPFVLLSIWCFSSMPKIKEKILKIGFIRDYYLCYTEKRAVKKSTKLFSLIFLWSALTLSMVLLNKWYMYLILIVVGISVTIHILYLVSSKRTKAFLQQAENRENEQKNDTDGGSI